MLFLFLCGSQLHTAVSMSALRFFASVFVMLEKVCECVIWQVGVKGDWTGECFMLLLTGVLCAVGSAV